MQAAAWQSSNESIEQKWVKPRAGGSTEGHRPSSRAEPFKNLVMDVIEAAVGHDNDMVARPRVRSEVIHDFVGRIESGGGLSSMTDPLDDAVRRQRLFRRKLRCAKDSGDHDGIRRVE